MRYWTLGAIVVYGFRVLDHYCSPFWKPNYKFSAEAINHVDEYARKLEEAKKPPSGKLNRISLKFYLFFYIYIEHEALNPESNKFDVGMLFDKIEKEPQTYEV